MLVVWTVVQGVEELVNRGSEHILAGNTSKKPLPVSQDNAEELENIDRLMANVDHEFNLILQTFENQVSEIHTKIFSIYPIMNGARAYSLHLSQTQMLIFNGGFETQKDISKCSP